MPISLSGFLCNSIGLELGPHYMKVSHPRQMHLRSRVWVVLDQVQLKSLKINCQVPGLVAVWILIH